MKSKSQIKRIGVQQGLSLDEIVKTLEKPEKSRDKLLEMKDKYNMSDKDFRDFLFFASIYEMTKRNKTLVLFKLRRRLWTKKN